MTIGADERTSRLSLPQVTLCAASSTNVTATVRALEASLNQVDFAAVKLFTDVDITPDHPRVVVVPITRLIASRAYSEFLLSGMVDHVQTSHCLIAQWDGHVLDARRWRSEFLDYDYIGASWPQFSDGWDVGNGGFSLRSRRLMEACRNPAFHAYHPEDIAIGRANRGWLESMGMRFAPRELADMFSAERAGDAASSFGFHGAWLMPQAIGADAFWDIYRHLDDRTTIRHNFVTIARCMGQRHWKRVLRLLSDQNFHWGKQQLSVIKMLLEKDRRV